MGLVRASCRTRSILWTLWLRSPNLVCDHISSQCRGVTPVSIVSAVTHRRRGRRMMPVPFSGRAPRDAPLFQASPARSRAPTPTCPDLASERRPLFFERRSLRRMSGLVILPLQSRPDGRSRLGCGDPHPGRAAPRRCCCRGRSGCRPPGPSVPGAPAAGAALGRACRPLFLFAASRVLTTVASGATGFPGQIPMPLNFVSLAVARRRPALAVQLPSRP